MEIVEAVTDKRIVYPDGAAFNYGQGTRVAFYGQLEHWRDGRYANKFMRDIAETNKVIWDPENVADTWKEFLYEVSEAREEAGILGPINVLVGMGNIVNTYAPVRDQLRGEFPDIDRGLDATNEKQIRGVMNLLISNNWRDIFHTELATFVPKESALRSYEEISHFIENYGLQDEAILDLGCGKGDKVLPLKFSMENGHVYAMDMNFIRRSQNVAWPSNIDKVTFMQADGRNLPLANDRIGLVCMVGVIPHLNDSDLGEIFEEIKRVLKPGGYVMVGPQAFQKDGSFRAGFQYFQLDANGTYCEFEVEREDIDN